LSDPLDNIKVVCRSTLSKLREAGFTTIESIAVTPFRELMSRAGVEYATAVKVCEEARRLLNVGLVTALELLERRKSMARCSTGSKALDGMLGGGIETQAMTELYGEYGVGKTQLCLMLSVMAQLPQGQGGLGRSTLYVDSEGTFSPERVYQIASARGLDPNDVLNHVIIARVYNSDHQSLIIDHLFKICPEENVKLVVVDSVISHLRGEYPGRENLAERQQKLNQWLHKLLRLAEAYNLAVVVTNQVQANPGQFFGDPTRPAGGNIQAHASNHRVYIRRGKAKTKVAKIIDSPYLPEAEAHFIITERGIEDLEGAEAESEAEAETTKQPAE